MTFHLDSKTLCVFFGLADMNVGLMVRDVALGICEKRSSLETSKTEWLI